MDPNRAIFSLPGDPERVWLYRALLRVASRSLWLERDIDFFCPLRKLELELSRIEESLPEPMRRARVAQLAGNAGLAGAIIGPTSDCASRELDVFRGALWLAMLECKATDRAFMSSAEVVASAVRSALHSDISAAATAIAPVLESLARSESLVGVTSAIDGLSKSKR